MQEMLKSKNIAGKTHILLICISFLKMKAIVSACTHLCVKSHLLEDAILPTVDQVIEGSRMLYDMAESIEEEQHIYNVCLHEIVRQVVFDVWYRLKDSYWSIHLILGHCKLLGKGIVVGKDT